MIKDHFELKVPEMGVPLGKVTVQLCNAETGEIESEIKKTNYVNPHFLKIYEKLMFGYLIDGGIQTINYNLRQMSRALVLTNADHEINTDEMFMKGEILAHAHYNDTQVVANQSGTYNTTESITQPGLYNTKYVYEFPTNVANGTFQSIYTGNFTKSNQTGNFKGMVVNLPSLIHFALPQINSNLFGKALETGYALYGNPQQIGYAKIPTEFNRDLNYQTADPDDIYERTIFSVTQPYGSADMYGEYVYTIDSNSTNIRRYNINSPGSAEYVGSLQVPSGYTMVVGGSSGIMIDRTNGYIFLELRTIAQVGSNTYRYQLAVFDINTLAFIRFMEGIEHVGNTYAYLADARNSTILKDGDLYHIVKTGFNSQSEYQGNARLDSFYFESINHVVKRYYSSMGIKLGPWLVIFNNFSNSQPNVTYAFPSFFSRVLLDEPVVKQPTQTMKIVYEFTTEPFSLI